MSRLDDIPVTVEPGAETGNVLPLLHEVLHALKRLVENGEETVIDLARLPLAPGEERRLEALLGTGELRAELNALGRSTLQEARYSGVWLVSHFNAAEEPVGKFIEITHIPDILPSQESDIRDGIASLQRELAGAAPGATGGR